MKRFLLYLLAGFLGSLVALFFFVFFWSALLLSGSGEPDVETNSILVLDLAGPLPERAPFDPIGELVGERATTLGEVTEALEKAAADDRIAGVWLQPDGVAASWASLGVVREALLAFRASGKPLIAASGPNGFDEASYYLASAADSVFTPPEAFFELNGFYVAAPFFAGTLDKLGVQAEVVRAGAYKGAAEPLIRQDFSPENREQVRDLLTHTSETFLTAVAEARGLSTDAVRSLVESGGLYNPSEALDAGLLDGLRYEQDVAAYFRTLAEQEADEKLRSIDLATYGHVSPRTAGLDLGPSSDRIAVVYAVGQIVPGESDEGTAGLLGSDTFTDAMREAVRDESVRAIVVRVDSPGGSATASDAMWHAVAEARERIPVVVSMGSVAASGGYYLAAPATRIFASPSTVTGSIGVVSVLFDATTFFNDRLGVTFDTLQTGPTAGLFALGQPLDARERAVLERTTETVYSTFVRRVADGRGLSTDSVRALGGGRVYTGTRALEIGLVDELGTLDDAIAAAADLADLPAGGYRTLTLPDEPTFLERLTGGDVGVESTMRALLGRTSSIEGDLLRRQRALLDEAARLHAAPQARLLYDIRVR